MTIQNLYVIQSNGTLIYSKDYHSIKEDAIIVSGFLSAIDSFAQTIGAGSQIKQIETDKYKFVGNISNKYKIKFIMICDKKDSTSQVQSLLDSIRQSFVIKFNKLLKSKKPYKDLEKFDIWEQNLDRIINCSELSSFETVVSTTLKDLKQIFKKIEED